MYFIYLSVVYVQFVNNFVKNVQITSSQQQYVIPVQHLCGTYIPLGDNKHQFVRDSSLSALDIQDNVQDKFFSDNIFF